MLIPGFYVSPRASPTLDRPRPALCVKRGTKVILDVFIIRALVTYVIYGFFSCVCVRGCLHMDIFKCANFIKLWPLNDESCD